VALSSAAARGTADGQNMIAAQVRAEGVEHIAVVTHEEYMPVE